MRLSRLQLKEDLLLLFTRDIILNALSCLTLNFKVNGQGYNIGIYLNEFQDIDLVLIDTKTSFYDIYYQRYHIECVTSFFTLTSKVKGQSHNQETFFL